MNRVTRVVFAWLLAAAVTASASGSGLMQKHAADAGQDIRLSNVVLYSSGLGYFERSGVVDGDHILDMPFKTKDINDLLKSLVLQDLDGGNISSVNYSAREPLASILRTFSIDLSGNPGVAAILQQVRGRDVSVRIQGAAPVKGTVVGLEGKPDAGGRNTQYLNIRTRSGIQSVDIMAIESFDFEDPRVQEELTIALELLANAGSAEEKRISIWFSGTGQRRVRIGYLFAMPVWKTSYRLVVDDEEHYLQGWAIVENTSDEDWEDVQLALVAGQPISFTMDLYRPIYINRPAVNPEVQSAVGPKISERAARPSAPAPQASRTSAPEALWDEEDLYAGAIAGDFAEESLGQGAFGRDTGVSSVASGGRSGEFFRYDVDLPVSIPRKESAMVPIVSASISGERVSIYNASSHYTHPFNSVRLQNDTGLDLKGGPVTVFDTHGQGNDAQTAYAGDAVLRSLVGEEETILSYSVDLSTTVSTESERDTPEVIKVTAKNGLLEVVRRYSQITTYGVESRGLSDRHMLIEHPILVGWDLVSPEDPYETTPSYYRFSLDIPGGGRSETEVEVIEQTEGSETTRIEGMSNSQLEAFLRDVPVPSGIERGLRGVIDRRNRINELLAKQNELESRRTVIYRDQDRIRRNMEALERDSALYKRYAEQLSDQEDELDNIVAEQARLSEQVKTLRAELQSFIQNIQG